MTFTKFTILIVVISILIVSAILISRGTILIRNEQGQIDNQAASTINVDLPEPTNYVVNLNDALKQETVDILNKELSEFDDQAQIAVLVLDSTEPLTIEEYGIKLAEKWKVGYKGRDNGAIIILATKDRKVRIEVGYGLEGDITDSEAGRIIDKYMIPYLKQNDWDKAIIAGVGAIKNELTK